MESDDDDEDGLEDKNDDHEAHVALQVSTNTVSNQALVERLKLPTSYQYLKEKSRRTKAFHNSKQALRRQLQKIDAQTHCYGVLYVRRSIP